MTKSKKEPKAQQQPSKLRKEKSSWNTIVYTLPNNIPHPKNNITNPIILRIINSNRTIPNNKKDAQEQSRQLLTTNENKNNTKHKINCTIPSIKSNHQK